MLCVAVSAIIAFVSARFERLVRYCERNTQARPSNWSIRALRKVGGATALACLTAGCSFVDNFDSRADTMNRSMTSYRNEATLLNIVRASLTEPMDFVTLTGATGHSTFTGSQGLPTYIIGPHTPATAAAPVVARNYVFGPNSIQETAGTDFTVSLLDDPQSYSALMTPLEPATIAFLMRENIGSAMFFPLIISELRIIEREKGKQATAYSLFTDSDDFVFCPTITRCEAPLLSLADARQSSPENNVAAEKLTRCHAHEGFCVPPAMLVLGYLQAKGLWFQVPAGSVPGVQQQSPPAQICFDSFYANEKAGKTSLKDWLSKTFADPTFDLAKQRTDSDRYNDKRLLQSRFFTNYKCDETQTPSITPSSSQGQSQQSPPNKAQTASSGMPSSLCINGACAASKTQTMTAKKAGASNIGGMPMYEIWDGNEIIQIFTRSTWGIYQFLGNMVRKQEIDGSLDILAPGINGDHVLFWVTKNASAAECFAAVTYSGENYCIPKQAYNTKRFISIVHELANLYTKPNNNQQPNSGTTRLTQ